MFPLNHPWFLANRFPVRRLDPRGIPAIQTISVTTDTTASEVIYNICPYQFRQLPNAGLLLLKINHVPAAGSEAFPVSLATVPGNSATAGATTTRSKIALLNGSGTQMASSKISQGNRYLIYYNKCDGVFQTVNHIVPPAAPATANARTTAKNSQ